MFEDVRYEDVNREERHYCALLMHAVLSSKTYRMRAVSLLNEGTQAQLDADDLQVFLEASLLRDYWHALGRPANRAEVRGRRRSVVVEALRAQGLGESLMGEDFFWTTSERTIAWYPGVWRYKSIRATSLDEKTRQKLSDLRTAFKAIPDLLFLSPGSAVYVEAKLESGEGKDGRGYTQFNNLHQIARLTKLLVPSLADGIVDCALLTRSRAAVQPADMASLLWKDFLPRGADRLDSFTSRGLQRAASAA